MPAFIELRNDNSEVIRYTHDKYFTYIKKGRLSLYPDFSYLSHWHDDVEFIYILSGQMSYNINGEIIDLNPGEGVFINSRQMHFGYSDCHKDCEYICVLLHPVLLCASHYIEKDYVLPLLNNHTIPFIKLQPHISWQKDIATKIHALYLHRKENAFPLFIQISFFQIWMLLYNHTSQLPKSDKKESAGLTALKNMITYIQNNYQNSILLDDIAQSGCVCKSSCGKIFKKHLHITPFDFLIQYRLKKSVELLVTSNLSVTDIAEKTGFTGASYYIETFKKYYHCTPLAYRKTKR